MTKLRCSVIVVLVNAALAFGCGGDSDDNKDTASGINITCAPGEFRALGEIGGTAVDITETAFTWNGGYDSGYFNDDKVGNFTVNTGDDGEPGTGSEDKIQVFAQFSGNAEAGAVSARAWVDLTSVGSQSVGNCIEDAAWPSKFLYTGDRGGKLELKSLRSNPFCAGAEIEGALLICVGGDTE